MAEGSSEQASSLEESSASLEEMASMTKQNADNAKQANVMANDARKASADGRDVIGKMSESISRIKQIALSEIEKKVDNGFKRFLILGDNELADIVEIAFRNISSKDVVFSRIDGFEEIEEDSIVIITDDSIKLKIKNSMNLFKVVTAGL